jgi:N-acetylneuraminate lyase
MSDFTFLRGVVAPIAAPCGEDEALDRPRLERLARKLLQTPVTGLYINGGTGDGGKLTTPERREIAAYLIPEAKKAGKISIVHVGQTLQREAVSLAEHAMEHGADAVASIPPKGSWDEIVQYYTALAATGAPVFVYYIPGVTGVTAGMPQLRRILDIPGVAGIKVSDWNIFLIRCLKREYPEKIVYSGLDEMLVPGLLYGADGTIGTWINLLPEFYCKVWALAQAGQTDKLYTLQKAYTEFLSLGWQFGILDAFQELMRAQDLALRCFRRPSMWVPGSMPKEQLNELLEKMNALNELAASL